MQDTSLPALPQDAADAGAFLSNMVEILTPFAFKAAGALAVLIIGLWLAGRLKSFVKRLFARSNQIDETLESFLASLIYYAALALVVITTLGVFGVPTTSFAAIIGAAGLAIGLALQGTLGHIASGVMLLAFRPFKIGDYVDVAGHEGSVREMTLFTTIIATVDNKKIIIPNGEVWAGSVVNFSAYDQRRVDLVFGVSYDDDLNKSVTVIRDAVSADARIKSTPEPVIAVDNLGDSSVDIICRVWVESGDYFPVKWALTKDVKERFDAAGITIPYPTQTVIRPAEQAA